jgi:hypothetical protein
MNEAATIHNTFLNILWTFCIAEMEQRKLKNVIIV